MRIDEVRVPPCIEDKLWAKHGVAVHEVEEAFEDYRGPWRTRTGADGQRRYYILGRTYGGRLLKVVFVVEDGRAVVVTARGPSGRKDERRHRRP